MKSALAFAALGLAIICSPPLAHHGTSNYETTAQTITLSGTVTEFVWANPHAYLLFDVKDDKGAVVHWAGEMNSPGVLKNAGWSKMTLKAGVRLRSPSVPINSERRWACSAAPTCW